MRPGLLLPLLAQENAPAPPRTLAHTAERSPLLTHSPNLPTKKPTVTKPERQLLAKHIMRYLSLQGMHVLKATPGAHTFTFLNNGPSFRSKGCKSVNHARVALNPEGLIDLTLGPIRGGK